LFDMKRREFITLLGGAAAAWPLVARAQQPAMPVIGFLHSASPDAFAPYVAAFRQGLGELGYVEGKNVAIEFRWAEGDYDRLPMLAAELVDRRVAVLAATGGESVGRAAKAATATIPIVFSGGGDPIEQGLVASFNRPGGNVTGVSLVTSELMAKRLEILREVVPSAALIGVLLYPTSATTELQERDLEAAARNVAQQLLILYAGNEREIDAAFAAAADKGVGAIIVGANAFFHSRRDQLVALASRHRIPVIYEWTEYVKAGGLMSYGTNLTDGYRQVGNYVGRILRGERPADLPVIRSTKVELVINLRTAKSLGLGFPLTLLARADEVIE
jgi:putative ABC transport system substrate-binding protein